MINEIIMTISSLLLIGYLFDITASKTKIPSVVLLILLGFGVSRILNAAQVHLPDIKSVLPFIGTLGLMLIVLEGSLELEINPSKKGLIVKAMLLSSFSIMLMSIATALLIQYFHPCTFKIALINAIPFSIISSAIAIPSVHSLFKPDKEFVIYESSLSDIFGVLLFNFILSNESYDIHAFKTLSLQLVVLILLSFIASLFLSFLINKITFHIKFIPIILFTAFIYALAKYFHLPSLLFIMIFGLFLGNLDELKKNKWIAKLHPESLDSEVIKFKELMLEITFLIRSLFFLVFGFSIQLAEIIQLDALLISTSIVIIIYAIRWILLKFLKIAFKPIVYVAPRGLITILLFLTIPLTYQLPLINKSVVLQVILLTSFIMIFGLVKFDKIHS